MWLLIGCVKVEGLGIDVRDVWVGWFKDVRLGLLGL